MMVGATRCCCTWCAVEMYSRMHLGRDVADVDPLHFLVQSLIALTNFMIILSFRNEIRRKKRENRSREARAAAYH